MKKKLLIWYSRYKRDLPWRRTKDPYAIWLSEVMLQQTTVETVIPYYHRFLKRFPSLQSVAEASEEELLKLWAGLGYYNRIRQFQKAAKEIEARHKGRVPADFDALLQLPGFGPYTAAAVASIAFGIPRAVVDGNVMRVISRVMNYGQDITLSGSKKFFQETALTWLDEKNPGDFNQAVMELGATVCTPKNPRCTQCPVQKLCLAFKTGNAAALPVKTKKIIYKKETNICFIYLKNGKVLLQKREEGEILAGQWEFPSKKTTQIPKHSAPKISHAIMNRRISIIPQLVDLNQTSAKKLPDGRWHALNQLNLLPLTTITRKVLAATPHMLCIM
ncbi:MAG: A/G-specific adenine glycosylase [Deltaproteobacteria bacterium]|nr:A/G-specific adenine glycosylase [Deltaproteobacteria bacterium]